MGIGAGTIGSTNLPPLPSEIHASHALHIRQYIFRACAGYPLQPSCHLDRTRNHIIGDADGRNSYTVCTGPLSQPGKRYALALRRLLLADRTKFSPEWEI